jgi:[ribosomal protein S18]-alanine N-acetyltransferase
MRQIVTRELPDFLSNFQLGEELFSISEMNIADVDEVCLIENTIYDFPWTKGNFVDSLNAGYFGSVVRIANSLERLRYPSGVVAYAMTMKLPNEVHLLNISVARLSQGKGIGRAYLKALVDDARHKKAEGMLLEVRPSNIAAINLYKTEGFSQVGLRKGYYPMRQNQREDALVFLRALTSQ